MIHPMIHSKFISKKVEKDVAISSFFANFAPTNFMRGSLRGIGY